MSKDEDLVFMNEEYVFSPKNSTNCPTTPLFLNVLTIVKTKSVAVTF